MNFDQYRLDVYLSYDPEREPAPKAWHATVYWSHEEVEVGKGATMPEAMADLAKRFARWDDGKTDPKLSFACLLGLDAIRPAEDLKELIDKGKYIKREEATT